ncbi:hypothetical protein [Nonomuraea longicatena]|uniref:Integral membrane protein n=1 Tax=Nonomuraea longicatena TaxID=83682 RepID=A0ABN1RB49_9ACTN
MSARNPRNQMYPATEDLPAAGRTGPLTALWRARTELAVLAAVVLIVATAARQGGWLPFVLLGGVICAPVSTRYGRSRLTAHLWCVVTRHRLQRVCLETTMHTRSGRIPLVLWITPSARGERALVLTRAGISAEEFGAYAWEIAAACWAGSVRVHRHRRWANLLTVETVRRQSGTGRSGQERLYGRSWHPLPSEAPDEAPTRVLTSV